jgi:hypothetical protein
VPTTEVGSGDLGGSGDRESREGGGDGEKIRGDGGGGGGRKSGDLRRRGKACDVGGGRRGPDEGDTLEYNTGVGGALAVQAVDQEPHHQVFGEVEKAKEKKQEEETEDEEEEESSHGAWTSDSTDGENRTRSRRRSHRRSPSSCSSSSFSPPRGAMRS